MSVVVVPARPPREGVAASRLAETSPLSPAGAADLAAAMLKDVVVAVERSGGDLLVNYLPDDELADEHVREESAEAAVRGVVRPALSDPDEARFEPQVGSSFAARVGNSVTHLLTEEDETSVQVLDPAAPLVGRTGIDGTAMKLRRSEVVVGPADRGRVYNAGFTEPIDFDGAYAAPAVRTLVDHAADAGLAADFAEYGLLVRTGTDLRSLVSLVRARETAGRPVPEHTIAAIEDLGLAVDGEELYVA